MPILPVLDPSDGVGAKLCFTCYERKQLDSARVPPRRDILDLIIVAAGPTQLGADHGRLSAHPCDQPKHRTLSLVEPNAALDDHLDVLERTAIDHHASDLLQVVCV